MSQENQNDNGRRNPGLSAGEDVYVGACLRFFEYQIGIGAIDQVRGPDRKQARQVAALPFQFHRGKAGILIHSLDFNERAQIPNLIQMDFDIVEPENFAQLFHDDLDSQGCLQNLFQLAGIDRRIKQHIGALGRRLIGTVIENQGFFDVALPDLQPTVGDIEIGVDLVVPSLKHGAPGL